jgi:hypothetical protein
MNFDIFERPTNSWRRVSMLSARHIIGIPRAYAHTKFERQRIHTHKEKGKSARGSDVWAFVKNLTPSPFFRCVRHPRTFECNECFWLGFYYSHNWDRSCKAQHSPGLQHLSCAEKKSWQMPSQARKNMHLQNLENTLNLRVTKRTNRATTYTRVSTICTSILKRERLGVITLLN